MTEIVSEQLMLILNSVQLGLYSVVLLLGCYRLIIAYRRKKSFLFRFFGLTFIIIAIQLSLQIYQVITLAQAGTASVSVLIVVNLYAMVFEAQALFLLSDYWGGTSEILTKKSTEEQIKNQKHRIRMFLLILWMVGISVYIGYAFGSNSLYNGSWQFYILVLGCQGLGIALLLWANVLQIIKGYKISSTLSRYQQWVSSLSIHKIQFCFLYWTSSLLNLLRSAFLIAVTVAIEVAAESNQYGWIFGYVYALSNIPILVIYLLGFSTKSQEGEHQSTLLEERKSNSDSSKKETELSRSSSERRRRETVLSIDRQSKTIEN